MKVVELRSRTGLNGLVLTQRETPRPGPRELLLEVQSVSINYRDLAIARGLYGSFPLPIVPLSDAATEVVETGEGVSRFRIGDRVCPLYVVDWLDGPPRAEVVARRLGGPQDGVLAEYVVVHESCAVRAPRHMTPPEAATLPIAGVTAWQSLFVQGNVKPGDVVVVQGTGGVSTFALQLANLAGARVIVTTSSDRKAAQARSLGAHEIINRRTTDDWSQRVMTLTGGRGADHVLDVVGGENLRRSVAATRIGGTISLIGFLAGTKGILDLPALFSKVVTLQAISVGSRTAFEQLVAACEAREMRPVISQVFPFERFREAFEHLGSGNHHGKVIINVS